LYLDPTNFRLNDSSSHPILPVEIRAGGVEDRVAGMISGWWKSITEAKRGRTENKQVQDHEVQDHEVQRNGEAPKKAGNDSCGRSSASATVVSSDSLSAGRADL
jgi:hypothetical protein